jgi:hypothetical protein
MFTPVSGTGYYSYQFAKDAEGNYPKFRYLYVDGEIATLAHEGILHFNDGEQYKMPFEKGYNASMGTDVFYKVNDKGETVKCSTAEVIANINAHPDLAKNKFYMYESIFANCQSEADYRQMELHIQCQWDFNILHVDRVDFNDSVMTESGKKCVAVYFNEEERDRFQIPGGYTLVAREHWMENSLAFLDEPGEYYYDLENVVLSLYYYDELPDNYITKKEARALGWEGGTPERYLEGSAIGGDSFGNREGLLPKKNGRKWYECDINYEGGYRGAERILFSNDGLIYYTDDHYESFEQLY